jgi:FkbM family methyltransferase
MLHELLGPDAQQRCDAIRARQRAELSGAASILVLGAGRTGRQVARILQSAGCALLGYLDDTPGKQGTHLDGLPIWSPEQARDLHGEDALVVVAIFSAGHSFRGTRRRLYGLGFRRVVSLFEVAACLPDGLLPFYFLDRPEHVLAARDHYARLFDALVDRRSQDELLRHLEFRLCGTPDVLPEPGGLSYQYFAGRLPEDVSFVDGGAFDGESVQAFLDLAAGRFSRVFAFEPDALNFRKLTAFHEALPDAVRPRVELVNAGLWSESTRLHFDATGTPASALTEGIGIEVAVVALDDHLQAVHPLFIKFDVEGAERNALLGARRLLQRGDTALAVAVYHQPDDLWELPALIQEINPAYRFGLRSHMDDGADLMLYAVPPTMPVGPP